MTHSFPARRDSDLWWGGKRCARGQPGRGSGRDQVLPQDTLIDGDAEAGALRDVEKAVLQGEILDQQIVAQRIVLAVELDDRLVLQCHRIDRKSTRPNSSN